MRLKATFTIYQEDGKFPSKAFRTGKRGWRWRLTAANGSIIADSGEAYATKASAKRAVERLILLLMAVSDAGADVIRIAVNEPDEPKP